MPILSGTLTGSIKSTAYAIPCKIKSVSLYNRTGGAVSASIGLVVGGNDRYIYQANLTAIGSAGSSFLEKTDIIVPSNVQILVLTSGSVDYVISLEGI